MQFEQNKPIPKLGERVGYVFAFVLFTTILFFILTLMKKLPSSWTYFHIMGLTVLIAGSGIGLRGLLK